MRASPPLARIAARRSLSRPARPKPLSVKSDGLSSIGMHPVGEVTRSPLAPRDDSRLAFSFHACHRSVMLSQPSRGQRKLMRTDDLKPTKLPDALRERSEEHTSELQSLMRISYAVFCLKKKKPIE